MARSGSSYHDLHRRLGDDGARRLAALDEPDLAAE